MVKKILFFCCISFGLYFHSLQFSLANDKNENTDHIIDNKGESSTNSKETSSDLSGKLPPTDTKETSSDLSGKLPPTDTQEALLKKESPNKEKALVGELEKNSLNKDQDHLEKANAEKEIDPFFRFQVAFFVTLMTLIVVILLIFKIKEIEKNDFEIYQNRKIKKN